MLECPELLLSFLVEMYFFVYSGNFHTFKQPVATCIVILNCVCMVSRQRSTLHDYSVQIGRSDSSMKNSARAQGFSEPQGKDLGMNYALDALHISLGKVASMRRRFTDGGTKNVAPRRSNFRKGTSETNQVRFVTVRFGRMLVRWSLEAWSTPLVLRSRDVQSCLQEARYTLQKL